MKRLIAFVIVVLIGLLIGVSAASALLANVGRMGAVSVGPWMTHPAVGAATADPLTRARVAKIGLLALTKSETVYYTAYTDSDGAALSSACHYEVAGRDLPARWWSITLYAEDNFLAMNGDEAHSASADSVTHAPDGGYVIALAPDRPDGAANWISTAASGAFSLSARLYNPYPSVLDDLGGVPLPEIRKLGCDGASESGGDAS